MLKRFGKSNFTIIVLQFIKTVTKSDYYIILHSKLSTNVSIKNSLSISLMLVKSGSLLNCERLKYSCVRPSSGRTEGRKRTIFSRNSFCNSLFSLSYNENNKLISENSHQNGDHFIRGVIHIKASDVQNVTY